MSVPRFKRKESGLEFVDNAYILQQDIMNLASKLSARWARIYQQPIDKLAFLLSDFVNMAYNINSTDYTEYQIRRIFLLLSRCCLNALEVRVMAMCRVLYNNPSKCFNRKNGNNYTFSEVTEMLDKKLEELAVKYQRQYDLVNGVIDSDRIKYSKFNKDDFDERLEFKLFSNNNVIAYYV